jgi:hypothetical protein
MEIVWQTARVHFSPDEQRELVLFLGKVCQAKTCQQTPLFTCDRGECIKPVEPVTDLPVYTPGTPGNYPDAAVTDRADGDGFDSSADAVSRDSRDAVTSPEASRPEVPTVLPDTQLPDAAEEDVPLATGGTGGTETGGVGGGGTTGTGQTGGTTGIVDTGADADVVSSGGRGGISATAGASGTGGVGGVGGVDAGAVDAPALDATAVDAPVDAPVDVPAPIIDAPSGTGDAGGAGGTDGGTDVPGGTGGPDAATGPSPGPCDVYAAAATPTPCVAAYSMVRLLSKSYTGPLFQVRAGSSSTNNTMTGGPVTDIMPGRDGYVDSTFVDTACAGTAYCTVSVLYDQSGNNNNLIRSPRGRDGITPTSGLDAYESIATKGKVKAGGHYVYSLFMNKAEGYRTATGVVGNNMPRSTEPQGIYELVDGTRNPNACCWDFGNVTTTPATSYAFADALFFGVSFWGRGEGTGPWFGIDFEGGIWTGGSTAGDPGFGTGSSTANLLNPSLRVPFALGLIKASSSLYGIRVANVATATDLTVAYQGASPVALNHQGGIVLGLGTDKSDASFGTFYEGAIVAGFPTSETELAIMKNIQAVGYSK